jgi:hypothetical protein
MSSSFAGRTVTGMGAAFVLLTLTASPPLWLRAPLSSNASPPVGGTRARRQSPVRRFRAVASTAAAAILAPGRDSYIQNVRSVLWCASRASRPSGSMSRASIPFVNLENRVHVLKPQHDLADPLMRVEEAPDNVIFVRVRVRQFAACAQLTHGDPPASLCFATQTTILTVGPKIASNATLYTGTPSACTWPLQRPSLRCRASSISTRSRPSCPPGYVCAGYPSNRSLRAARNLSRKRSERCCVRPHFFPLTPEAMERRSPSGLQAFREGVHGFLRCAPVGLVGSGPNAKPPRPPRTHVFELTDPANRSIIGYVHDWAPNADVEPAENAKPLEELRRQLCDPDEVRRALVRRLMETWPTEREGS